MHEIEIRISPFNHYLKLPWMFWIKWFNFLVYLLLRSKVSHPNITQLLAVTLTSEPTSLVLVSALP